MTPFCKSDSFDTWGGYKVADALAIQTGDVIALATSGTYNGQLGPFDKTATDGRQTLANVVGVSAMRVSAVEPTGVQERFLANQDGRLCTYYTRVGAADANNAWIVDADGTRKTIQLETGGTTTKNYLATRQFRFIN